MEGFLILEFVIASDVQRPGCIVACPIPSWPLLLSLFNYWEFPQVRIGYESHFHRSITGWFAGWLVIGLKSTPNIEPRFIAPHHCYFLDASSPGHLGRHGVWKIRAVSRKLFRTNLGNCFANCCIRLDEH